MALIFIYRIIMMIKLKNLLKEDNFNLTDKLMIVFSGNEKFMDRVAVNVLKKYGFDKTQINRSYDANEGIVEFTVNMPSDIAQEIGDALEKADGVTNQYGGYYELEK